jgi:hypothetical protein
MVELSSKKKSMGSSLTELSAALIAMAFILILVLDCAKMVIGAQINDNTCRKAARVAASGDPSTAKSRAESIVNRAHIESAGLISNLRLISVINTVNSASDQSTIQLSGGNITGAVIVTTAADIEPFFVGWLSAKQRFVTLKSEQSFPYTYILPATAPAN